MATTISTSALRRVQNLLQSTKPWTAFGVTASAGVLLVLFWKATAFRLSKKKHNSDASTTDPGLLKKHSTHQTYDAAGFIYPSIRTFYHPHAQAAKLPTLPLLVFIHGLGGSVAQFAPLLTSLVNVGPCLAIDFPGCGTSAFEPRNCPAYTTESLAMLLATAIERYRDATNGQQVILIGHSMGCSIGALLASSSSPNSSLPNNTVSGFVAICPKAGPRSPKEAHQIDKLRNIPTFVFDLFRLWDRRRGVNSASVSRVVGSAADLETRKLQLRFNKQSKTAVFLKMLPGFSPPGEEVWSAVKVPLFLLSSESDKLTPREEVEKIAEWLRKTNKPTTDKPVFTTPFLPAAAGDVDTVESKVTGSDDQSGKNTLENTETGDPRDGIVKVDHVDTKHSVILKVSILPAPASHGLIYDTLTVRIVSGLIEAFLDHHIDHRLSVGWQLQHLTTEGKWDVKNLKKWQAIQSVSEPIAGVFRAMKTLREVDEHHCPKEFVKEWSASAIKHGVGMVIDISHESPVYDPKGLEAGGVEYHKFPTVSKLPPTADEVEAFIALVDRLRPQIAASEYDGLVGVHCHYGFNRTGFFIVCYMVERLGYKLQDAVDEFAAKRAPGIKHGHFVNELYVRYAVKMERRETIVG